MKREDWHRLVDRGRPRTYRSDAALVAQGDPAGEVMIILRGFVLVVDDEQDDGPVVLAVRGRGDLIGELALWLNCPRTATVRACGPVTVWTFDPQNFARFLVSHPAVTKPMADTFAAKLFTANQRQRDSMLRPARCRMAVVLEDIVDRYGEPVEDGVGIALTQHQLAMIVGVHKSSIERELRPLRDRGVVRTARRRIIVMDRAALRAAGRSS
jgi:CRP-like cAMP-binding protein